MIYHVLPRPTKAWAAALRRALEELVAEGTLGSARHDPQ